MQSAIYIKISGKKYLLRILEKNIDIFGHTNTKTIINVKLQDKEC